MRENDIAVEGCAPAPKEKRRQADKRPLRHRLLIEWNDTRTSPRIKVGFLGGFEDRCARAPDALAIADGHRQLTYGELDRRSARLAGALRGRGVRPETPVGLLLGRRLDTVVAALGILKAGGVYLPLDPTYPSARLESMIADADIDCILTSGSLRVLLSGRARARGAVEPEVLLLDELDSDNDGIGQGEPVSLLAAAYVIYTSGSTGTPRGVVVSHRALGWYCAAAAGHYEIVPGDRLLQLASISFDISIGEIFPCLMAGATVVFPGNSEPGADVFSRCRQQAITILFPPTALWHELAELAGVDPGSVPETLRLVSFGGERLLAARLDAWRRAVGAGIRLVNGYGPTETTVEATIFDLTAAGADAATLIGRPVADARVYVLDRHGLAAAEGAEGELAIGGAGLARGYHRCVTVTARRFLPDAFAEEPGQRLYLTGDRVRWRPDGQLEILGRFDQQIKIRGFRVEPAEIEAVLGRHPAVHNAAVVAWRPRDEISTGGNLLSAFVVAERETQTGRHGGLEHGGLEHGGLENGTGILGVGETRSGRGSSHQRAASLQAELRDYLLEQLPGYMVPSSFVVLDALPLTPNGKVDRTTLMRMATDQARPWRVSGEVPAGSASHRHRRPYVAPRSTVEATLARIWGLVLRVDRLGVDDDFFELGGDSILSIQIATRAFREALRFSPQAIFEHPTVAELATVTKAAPAHGAGRHTGPVIGSAPLTPVQCWLFYDAEMPEPDHFNQSMMLEVRHRLDLSILEHAVEHLLAHHDVLRARFERSKTGWRQVFTPSEPIDGGRPAPVAGVDLSRLDSAAAAHALRSAAADLQTSLDIEHGPVSRFIYFDLGRGSRRLLIPVHHLVMDAVSWSILLGDLERIYRRLESGSPVRLPARTTSYKAWAELQAEHAGSPELLQELDFWATLPADVPALPRDFEDGGSSVGSSSVGGSSVDPNSVDSAGMVSIALDPRTTGKLLREVPAAYRTRIDDVLLCALARALAPWAGTLRVDLESHGREEISDDVDLSRTIGWFTSTFPVHLDLGGISETGEALVMVKEMLRKIPGNGIGYGMLRDLAGKADHLGKPAEMSFNYLGQLDSLLANSKYFASASEPRGPEKSRLGRRSYVLEIEGGVVRDRLWINWHFSRNLHRRETIEGLATTYRRELEALIAHCLTPGTGGITPSDFPLAGLDRDRLQALVDDNVEDIYALSPMQQGMLFHTLYAPGSAVYFEQSSWSIEGDLDAAVFRRAWERLTAHHAILRTSFAWQDLDRPLQLVHRHLVVPFRVEDWRGRPSAEQVSRLESLLHEDRTRGFDLARAPLMRLVLARLDDRSWRLLWSVHHLLLDGWSIAALFDELFDIYGALSDGREPALLPRRSFRDFIAWLEAQDQARDEAFWRRTLAGFTAPTPVLTSGRRAGGEPSEPEGATGSGGEIIDVRRLIDSDRTAALVAFARHRRMTIGTILRGAWALVLARSCGQRDVVLGATVSGRPASLEGADSIIGLLINTLPVRVRFAPRQRLLPWLDELQAASLELHRHEHAPLVEIRKWSEVPPHLPLFESLLVFENYPTETALEAEQVRRGLEVGGFVGYSQTNYALTLGILPGRELTLEASIDPARFEPTAALRLLGHLDVVLAGIVEGVAEGIAEGIAEARDRPLATLEVLTAAERHQMLIEWNADGYVGGGGPSSVHRRFECQVERSPDTIALVAPPRSSAEGMHQLLSYGELNRRANQLARALADLGVGPECRVGLALGRSADLVIAIFAVLKAGGAYLPLDPSHPRERLHAMLTGSGATLLLTDPNADADSASRLENSTIATVDLGQLREIADRRGRRNLAAESDREISRHGLAYVLHTSGSTGTPKGVMVSHGALLDTLAAWEQAYRLRAVARTHLQVADFTFDVAAGDLLRAFGTGATLVLCPRDLLLEPRALEALMRRVRVDCVELVPATSNLLARQLESGGAALDHMRLLAVGSDSWRMADLCRVLRWTGRQARVVSSYGVTEATIDSTFFDAGDLSRQSRAGATSPTDDASSSATLEGDLTVPLGRPLPGTSLFVLDRRFTPAGIGVPGELLLAGNGLARGYVNRPASTAERFVPDPNACDGLPGARLYRTGDLVRYLADGNLEFLGRVDQQVKIRGFRIEPAEVEAALRRHPAVAEAIVVAYQGATGERVLAACVVPMSGNAMAAPAASGELRAFLGSRLPSPMIPSLFVTLDALPLNRNGKVDRATLARIAVSSAQAAPSADFEAPTTTTEKILAEIWGRILGIGRVDRRDDFFMLGGHSLRAVSLMVEIERRLGVRLPLASLFRQPTLADLARRIDAPYAEVTRHRILVEIARGEHSPVASQGHGRPPFYCAHPVGGHVLCYADLARHLGQEQPFFGLQCTHAGGAVGTMARRYLEAIRDQRPRGPYYLGGWSMGGILAYEIARRLRAMGETVGALVLIDCAAPGSPSAIEVEAIPTVEGFALDLGIEGNGGPPRSLPTAIALRGILDAGRRHGILGKNTGFADIERLYRLFESNDQALKHYRPRPYGGRLTLVRSNEWQGEPTLGWGELADRVDVRLVAGDHYSMVREPLVRDLAEILKDELARAQ